MAVPKHEAFIDLENMLARKLGKSWAYSVKPILDDIEKAISEGRFIEAERLAHTIETKAASDSQNGTMVTVGLAALYLGVSRVTPAIKTSATFKDVPKPELAKAQKQLQTAIERNGNKQVMEKALQVIAMAETLSKDSTHTTNMDGQDTSFDPTIAGGTAALLLAAVKGATSAEDVYAATAPVVSDIIKRAGDQMLDLNAQVYVSRLNTFGFLNEAIEQGIEFYEVSEVLDDRTCGICAEMDGTRFPVNNAMLHTTAILAADDPDISRMLAPWPSQSESSIDAVAAMSQDELENAGLMTPPYHAGCRGILIPSEG